MIKVAELMGGTDVEEQMKDILEFEKKLAAVSSLVWIRTIIIIIIEKRHSNSSIQQVRA